MLVSLAVIFLPMIFKGDGSVLDKKTTPPEPDYRFPPPRKTPEPPPMATKPIVPVGDSVKENVSKKTGDNQKPGKAGNDSVPEKQVEEAVASTIQQDEKKQDEKIGNIKPDKVQAWIVQVGSFSSEPNAIALRDKLRKKGFASFVEAVKGKKGMVYRVRVGPELTRELADKLKGEVESKAKLKGLVQSYP